MGGLTSATTTNALDCIGGRAAVARLMLEHSLTSSLESLVLVPFVTMCFSDTHSPQLYVQSVVHTDGMACSLQCRLACTVSGCVTQCIVWDACTGSAIHLQQWPYPFTIISPNSIAPKPAVLIVVIVVSGFRGVAVGAIVVKWYGHCCHGNCRAYMGPCTHPRRYSQT